MLRTFNRSFSARDGAFSPPKMPRPDLKRDGMSKRFELEKILPILKVDEDTHMVWGVATSEVPDSEKEIADYEGCKKAYTDWATETLAKTADGADPSLGNIRVMHQLVVGGKAIKIEFNDAAKSVLLGTVPANDEVWELIKGGFLRGYSHAGKYAWKKPEGEFTRYAPVISEVSYVDRPANPEANFDAIKADSFQLIHKNGSMELVKFASPAECQKRLGEFMAKSQAAATVTVPAPSPEKLARHGLMMLGRAEESKRSQVKAAAIAAAKAAGLNVADEADRVVRVCEFLEKNGIPTADGVRKSMYSVSCMAEVLTTLSYLHNDLIWEREFEGDESPVPDDIRGLIEELKNVFLALAEEEASELADSLLPKADSADAIAKKGEGKMELEEMKKAMNDFIKTFKADVEGMLEKAAKSLSGHFTKSAAHHEKMAAHHSELAKAHADMAECSDGETKKCMKAMAGHHEKMAKAHASQGDHLAKMATSHADGDKAAAEVPEKTAAVPESSVDDLKKSIQDQVNTLVRDGIAEAMKTVKESAEFKKSIEEAVGVMAGEALGKKIEPSKVTAVLRPGQPDFSKGANGTGTASPSDSIADTGL